MLTGREYKQSGLVNAQARLFSVFTPLPSHIFAPATVRSLWIQSPKITQQSQVNALFLQQQEDHKACSQTAPSNKIYLRLWCVHLGNFDVVSVVHASFIRTSYREQYNQKNFVGLTVWVNKHTAACNLCRDQKVFPKLDVLHILQN